MNAKTELYRSDDPERLKKKYTVSLAAVCVIAALALIACVLFCVFTGASNAERMQLCAIAVTAVAGWVDIYLLTFRVRATARERDHARRMLEGKRETVCGTVTLSREVIRIRNSITVRSVLAEKRGKTRRLYVNARCADALERALGDGGRECELDVVGGYVAAFAVSHESH
ncbi:MAG: hypothetical protein II458_05490 [Oscillospiraceae bacterium]|nr:hypothetical protein [Oscillospiraceae bacterium]